MTTIIKNAKVFRADGAFQQGDVAIDGEYFSDASAGGTEIDAGGRYAIPGLIDVHLHGCVGRDFTEADVDGIAKMARYQAENGITAICPTTFTLPEAQLDQACRNIAAACDTPEAAAIAGIHLEGPFFSPHKAGAQNPAYMQPPNIQMVERLQAAAGGLVKILSIAPEMPGAMELIDVFADEIVCSLAHTTANYEIATEALARGARHITHLYNAMPPLGHREPGVIGAALDSPHCNVELICDNVHIHPAVVRATLRMFGDDRVIMISDSMAAAGLGEGTYEIGGLAVDVRGNTARLANNGPIAGSVSNLMQCVRTAVTQMNIPLAQAVKCASVNPAKAIGIFNERGSIAPGKYADLVLLNADLSIHAVYLRGKILNK
ncbi:MAG: N-acetylglucosamine-6-phosphate deacetylase [Clostridiales bacterium]|jgi:N-acetylglucosamine-6-phosphate deacetylase|nr:N-acetylglucosamine-6-phosphate deacetylase [Clostridiales bacterium]